jgi:hypothetical protein
MRSEVIVAVGINIKPFRIIPIYQIIWRHIAKDHNVIINIRYTVKFETLIELKQSF